MGRRLCRILLAKQAANCLGFLLGRVLAGATRGECPSREGRSFSKPSPVVLVGFCWLSVALPSGLAAA